MSISYLVACIFLAVDMESAKLPKETYWILGSHCVIYILTHIFLCVSLSTRFELVSRLNNCCCLSQTAMYRNIRADAKSEDGADDKVTLTAAFPNQQISF